MRRIVTAACLALLCVGCDSGAKRVAPSPPVAKPRCNLAVVWHGVRYVATTPRMAFYKGRSLGAGGAPSCIDVLGGETGASRAVEVRTLVGVDPRLAVTVVGDRLHVYRPAQKPRLRP
jgi:hypothetical protein